MENVLSSRLTKVKQNSIADIMYALAVLLIIVSAVSGSVTPRIVGGQNAEDHKYPYQVLILIKNFPSCGGSIINDRFILTAAHCIYQEIASDFTIVAGTTDLTQKRAIYAVDMLIMNENYNPLTYNDDIGLIRLKTNLTYNIYIQPIALGSKYDVTPGEIAVVTGWGRLGASNSVIPHTLQEINVTVIDQESCAKSYLRLSKNSICTFEAENKGLCMGDSGGPLVVKGEQVGIVSHGYPCAIGEPDVYTRVYPYRDWIANVTKTWYTRSQANTNTWTIWLLAASVVLTRLCSPA
ncbi:Chymotrypsin-2 [Eufriesea mexicana]|uniref:Chymotrypsin-2 n=2 Tax=Eufriesea mexicana TaxID=516756 RepID=A0A310SLT9_9HYME|nr:Chymotrypsin-2 [Eufriesea mexicana]